MTNKFYMDVRTNAIVRVTRELNSSTVMVLRIKDKQKYIVDKSVLKPLKIR